MPVNPCEFCTFANGRLFNIFYHGSARNFDKLDISTDKPYLTRVRGGRVLIRRPVEKCPQCGRNLL